MHSTFFFWSTAFGAASAYTVTTSDRFMLKNIDPIVFPGQYGKSHMHSFFGSDAVTINTTTSAELQAGCSSTENPNDYSVYWVPTLVYTSPDDGEQYPVPINRFSAYYIGINDAEVAIPQNYKGVAGSAGATSQADVNDLAGIQWFCEGDDDTSGKDEAAFPTSTCSTHLQTLLLFHDCVNEDTLDSAYSGTQNWNSTYKATNRCPEGMKRMPQLRFSIRYDLRTALPDGWSGQPPLELASGPSYSSHGDFINGWLPEAATNMLQATSKTEYAAVDGPDGAASAGSVCGASNAVDADPDHGTSDYATSVALISKRNVAGRRRAAKA